MSIMARMVSDVTQSVKCTLYAGCEDLAWAQQEGGSRAHGLRPAHLAPSYDSLAGLGLGVASE